MKYKLIKSSFVVQAECSSCGNHTIVTIHPDSTSWQKLISIIKWRTRREAVIKQLIKQGWEKNFDEDLQDDVLTCSKCATIKRRTKLIAYLS